VDVQNAAKEDTELSMNYEKEDEVARLVTELADLLRLPRPQGVFELAAALQKRIVSLQSELKPIQQAISIDSCSKWDKIYVAASRSWLLI
jgi:hypothetical protein